jgi:hypothetical protein
MILKELGQITGTSSVRLNQFVRIQVEGVDHLGERRGSGQAFPASDQARVALGDPYRLCELAIRHAFAAFGGLFGHAPSVEAT